MPSSFFFPTNATGLHSHNFLFSRTNMPVVVLLLSFLWQGTLAFNAISSFWLSSPIKRFMYSSTLSSVILFHQKQQRIKDQNSNKKIKPIHSHVVITTSPLILYVRLLPKKSLTIPFVCPYFRS